MRPNHGQHSMIRVTAMCGIRPERGSCTPRSSNGPKEGRFGSGQRPMWQSVVLPGVCWEAEGRGRGGDAPPSAAREGRVGLGV